MFTVREIIDDHFAVRAISKELPTISSNAYNTQAIVKQLQEESPLIHDFLKRYSGIHLMGSYSLFNEKEDILVLFPPVEDVEEVIEELKYASSLTTNPFILEEISFLVYCVNIAANRNGDNMNENFDDDEEMDTCNEENVIFDDIVDDAIVLTTDRNNNLDTEFLHAVLNDKAPYTNLSFETTSGCDMYWFYKKVLKLDIPASKIHVYVKNGAYCIIVPCND